MAASTNDKLTVDLERLIRETLATIRYGTLKLVVQDGLVILVNKSEKIRLGRQWHMHGSGI